MTEVQPLRPPSGAALPVAATIRPLCTPGEYAAAVALQRHTWGRRYQEVVHASVQKLAQRLGGVASGAFDEDGALIGFVFGMTGMMEGRLVHWSHMLAVADVHRNGGLGRRLKEHQRSLLEPAGVTEMRWTFDPLVARNGHLNLNVLGATVLEYVEDAYGDTGSDLHAFGTDRLVVRWPVARSAAERGEARVAAAGATGAARLLNSPPGVATPAADDAWNAEEVQVQVPADVETLGRIDLAQARAWRACTRQAFRSALSRGYRVAGFFGAPGGPGTYVLRRGAA